MQAKIGMAKALASRLAIGLAALTLASAQTMLTDPKKIADAQELFKTLEDSQSGCQVALVKPHFMFSLRLQAGYIIQPAPADSPAKWIVLTKITPQNKGGKATYLAEVMSLTAGDGVPPIEGSFWLGKGRYTVDFLMFDAFGDVCRRQWQIDGRLNFPATNFKPTLAPGAVADNFPEIKLPGTARRIGRLTILLHAASLLQNQTTLLERDRALLLDATAALMQETAARSVRIVAFNLEQQKELFRNENFTFAALPDLARSLGAVQPVTVDYSSLQNHANTADFMQTLVLRELEASAPADAVVFLGPRSIYRDKPRVTWEPPHQLRTRFFYLLLDRLRYSNGISVGNLQMPPFRGAPVMQDLAPIPWRENVGPNNGPDSIQYAVSKLGGITLTVDSVASFAEAAAKVAHVSSVKR
jgi:hypothetical protein